MGGTCNENLPKVAARSLTSLHLALEAGPTYSHISLDNRLWICGFQLIMQCFTPKSILRALSTIIIHLSNDLGGRKTVISKVVVKASRTWTKLECLKKSRLSSSSLLPRANSVQSIPGWFPERTQCLEYSCGLRVEHFPLFIGSRLSFACVRVLSCGPRS